MNFFGSKSRDKVQSTTLFGNVRKINFPMLVRVLGWLLMIAVSYTHLRAHETS